MQKAVFPLIGVIVAVAIGFALVQAYNDGERIKAERRAWFDDCRTKHTIGECRVLFNVYYPENPDV